jgi:CheY-like chemotaxis protein
MPDRAWVLHADDSDDDALLVERAFRPFRTSVDLVRAKDGEEAIQLLSERATAPPAVVLLDLKMPRVGGLEVLRFMRESPAVQSVPVLVFSSSDEPRDIDEARNAGADDYLVKPIHLPSFTTVLQERLGRWGVRSS